jgi:peptidoglycan/xylan/chitin deacetylase (PgdA/CDA1 family)
MRLAEIFKKNRLKATFYIPIKKTGSQVLSKKEIKHLASAFEIGAHTYNHVDLTRISRQEVKDELKEGKEALEDIIGRRVQSFAFPFGHYNGELVKMVAMAGFSNCRSGRIINFNAFNNEGFLQHPNLHIYPHSLITGLRHCLKYGDPRSFVMRLAYSGKSHLDLVRPLMALKSVHFWCHSEDMEKYGLWDIFNNI